MRFPPGILIEELPEDWRPVTLGKADSIETILREEYPQVTFSNDVAFLETPSTWMEISIRAGNDQVDTLGIRTNAGADASGMIKRLCTLFGASLLDVQTMEIIELCNFEIRSMGAYQQWSSTAVGE